MPLYEYQCLNCGTVHEIMQKFSDPPLAECPGCKGKIKKLISLSSFSLKGTGWYVTDYKKGSPATSKPAESQKTTEATPTKSQEGSAAQSSATQTPTLKATSETTSASPKTSTPSTSGPVRNGG